MTSRQNITRKRYLEEISPSQFQQNMLQNCIQRFAQANNMGYNPSAKLLGPLFEEAMNMGLIGSDACDYAVREGTRKFQHMFLRPDLRSYTRPPYVREFY